MKGQVASPRPKDHTARSCCCCFPCFRISKIFNFFCIKKEEEIPQLNIRQSRSAFASSTSITRVSMPFFKTPSAAAFGKSYQESRAVSSQTTMAHSSSLSIIEEVVRQHRHRLISDFDLVTEALLDDMSIESYLYYITNQRVLHMPHRGSKWDRVLRWAEFFGLQIERYVRAVGDAIPGIALAAQQILMLCRVLLELGPENSAALETTFSVFYKLGVSLSFLVHNDEYLHASQHISEEIARVFQDVHYLTFEVATYYQRKVSGMSHCSVRIDFASLFGRSLGAIQNRREHIIELMWASELGHDAVEKLRNLHSWLKVQDEIVRSISHDRLDYQSSRAEYTCEWFHKHLVDFSKSKEDVLYVSGPSGCGKSVLSEWIVERLQRPLGQKVFQVLSYAVQSDTPHEANSFAVAKSLALQLLDLNLGNDTLFDLCEAACRTSTKDVKAAEQTLWKAVESGLKSTSGQGEDIVIVLDGLDALRNADIHPLVDRLSTMTSAYPHARAIILSSEAAPSCKKGSLKKVEITADDTHDDIEHFLEEALNTHKHFASKGDKERDAAIDWLLKNAAGSFLYAALAVELLAQESTHDGYKKALECMPKTLQSMFEKLLDYVSFSRSDTKVLLSTLLVAQRPFTTSEIGALLQVDLQKKCFVERDTRVTDDINKACGPFVVIDRHNLVRIRHGAIRKFLEKIQVDGKRLPSAKDAQRELTCRVLLYLKLALGKRSECSLEPLSKNEVQEFFTRHLFLEYATRYWTVHFHHSPFAQILTGADVFAELTAYFPDSTTLGLIEWACWSKHITSAHDYALRIREKVFGGKHVCLLQSFITCGFLHRHSSTDVAARFFYKASALGQIVLAAYSSIVLSCTTEFLTCTETIKITERTEIITYREHMLKYIIIAYKHNYGASSEIVIKYMKILAELYVELHEEENAACIYREIRVIIIERYGEGSAEDLEISENLLIVLRKQKKEEEIIQYSCDIFATAEECMEVWDLRRIKITLELVLSYECEKKYHLAEETLIVLWAKLLEVCKHKHSVEIDIHISVLNVAIEYVRFLERRCRYEEARSILLCVWAEYGCESFDSIAFYLKLKVIGQLMKTFTLLSVAVTVFKKIVSWFEATGRTSHEEFHSCTTLVTETVEEVTKTTIKETSTTTTTTTTEETIRKISHSGWSCSKATVESICAWKALITLHMEQKSYSAAIECITKSLSIMWKMSTTWGGVCALPSEFVSESIEFAMLLAQCHIHEYHYHEAEDIYLYIYRACRYSCKIDEERTKKAISVLISFYEEHKCYQKMIEIYKEIIVEYRRYLGLSHALTLQTLYILGRLCRQHGHGYAEEYYREICVILNKGHQHCHVGAIEAMICLFEIYYEQRNWVELEFTCKTLWQTFVHHHSSYKFEATFIQLLYARYIYVLEFHRKCEFSFLIEIALQYKETCIKFFGASASITIHAFVALAEIYMRKEQHYEEAISCYEEVITRSKTTKTTTTTAISESTLTTVKRKLTAAYVHVCSRSSTTTTVTHRAISMLIERFELLKVQYGCAHTETLKIVRELVILYRKLKTTECTTKAIVLLQGCVIDIMVQITESSLLSESATFIAKCFVEFELVEVGLEIVSILRRQIITRHFKSSDRCGFKHDHAIGRISFVFLATFEATLRVTASFSILLADMLTEVVFYENYQQCLKKSEKLEITVFHGAQLYVFWAARHRHEENEALLVQLFSIWWKQYGKDEKLKGAAKLFLTGLIERLGLYSQQQALLRFACSASLQQVEKLLQQGQYQSAYEVAAYAFEFLYTQNAYHDFKTVGYAFKLSGFMAGRSYENKSGKECQSELKQHMLVLSNRIMKEVFHVCESLKIDFTRLHVHELNSLVGLLGEQRNYVLLESLLSKLYTARTAQRSWSSSTILTLARRLVSARFLAEKPQQAVKLAEDITYNLRRAHGLLDEHTLKVTNLLYALYTHRGRHADAMGLAEETLRAIVTKEDTLFDEDDSPADFGIGSVTADVARKQYDMLRWSYSRLGKFDKSPEIYKKLVSQLLHMREFRNEKEFEGTSQVDKWNVKQQPAQTDGTKVIPKKWDFFILEKDDTLVSGSSDKTSDSGKKPKPRRPGLLQRYSSYWGFGKKNSEKGSADGEEAEQIYSGRSQAAQSVF